MKKLFAQIRGDEILHLSYNQRAEEIERLYEAVTKAAREVNNAFAKGSGFKMLDGSPCWCGRTDRHSLFCQTRREYHANLAAALAARDRLERNDEMKVKCSSCGVSCDKKQDFCYGCGKIVCVTCSEKYDHLGNGKHGKKRVKKIHLTVDAKGV